MSKTTERRQEILELLNCKRFSTYEQLAIEFNVSKRTIQNDIEELTLSAPIYTVSGNGGGIKVVEGWHLSKEYLSEKQEKLLTEMLSSLNDDDAKIIKCILNRFSVPKK